MTTCQFRQGDTCTHQKASGMPCVLLDARAVNCKLLVAWHKAHRVVDAPSTPVAHKYPAYVKRTPTPAPATRGPTAPRGTTAGVFDALLKGLK